MFVMPWLLSRFGENVNLLSGHNYKRGLYLVKAGLSLTTPYFNRIDFFPPFISLSYEVPGHVLHACALSYARLEFPYKLFWGGFQRYGFVLDDLNEVPFDLMWPRTLILFHGV